MRLDCSHSSQPGGSAFPHLIIFPSRSRAYSSSGRPSRVSSNVPSDVVRWCVCKGSKMRGVEVTSCYLLMTSERGRLLPSFAICRERLMYFESGHWFEREWRMSTSDKMERTLRRRFARISLSQTKSQSIYKSIYTQSIYIHVCIQCRDRHDHLANDAD